MKPERQPEWPCDYVCNESSEFKSYCCYSILYVQNGNWMRIDVSSNVLCLIAENIRVLCLIWPNNKKLWTRFNCWYGTWTLSVIPLILF